MCRWCLLSYVSHFNTVLGTLEGRRVLEPVRNDEM